MAGRVWVIATLLLVLLGARPAAALTCIPLADVVARMDVIVQGEIEAIPEPGRLELTVSRYYKGSGPTQLRAAVTGLGVGERMDWNGLPQVGNHLLIGFVRQGEGLANEACNLFVQLQPGQAVPAEVRALIGEGGAPTPAESAQGQAPPSTSTPSGAAPAPTPRTQTPSTWLLSTGALAVGLLTGLIYWRQRRRRH